MLPCQFNAEMGPMDGRPSDDALRIGHANREMSIDEA